MRFFELTFITLLILTFLTSLVNGRRGKLLSFVLFGIAIVVFFLHIFFETYRWQMIPSYFLTVVVPLFIAKQTRKRMFSISIIVLSLMSIILPIIVPVFSLPEPTGPYSVGLRSFHIQDTAHENIFTKTANDKRELMVTVSYPTMENIQAKQPAQYLENSKQFIKELSIETKVPSFFLQYLKLVNRSGIWGGELADSENPFPVVLFSPGYPRTRFMYTGMIEEMVSQGYIVISIDHPYPSSITSFPNGKSILKVKDLPSPLYFEKWDEIISALWVKDQQFVLDFVHKLALDSNFKGKIDTTKIGIIGHAFGGAAATQTLIHDDRVQLAINMDGSLFGNRIEDIGNKKQLLLLKSDVDSNTFETRKHRLGKFGKVTEIKGAKHMSFSDYYFYSPILSVRDKINVYKQNKVINNHIINFLNKNFKL